MRHRESSPVMDHHAMEIEEVTSPAVESGTVSSASGPIGEDQLPRMTKCEQFVPNETGLGHAVTCCLDSIGCGLKKRGRARSFQAQALSCTIFRIPEVLRGINSKAENPELVSIGPYHRGRERLDEFEELKWFLLESFLRRTDSNVESLINLVAEEASSAVNFYSEPGMTFNGKFVEMMLLDGCFVVELLLQICRKQDAIGEYDPILRRQGIIPILISDLLKLENQLPYFFLQSLFEYSSSTRIEARTPYLSMLALRVFNLVNPGAMALRDKYSDLQYQHYDVIKKRSHKHLLDLFYFTLFLVNSVHQNDSRTLQPTDKSIPSVTQLRRCGIKFKSKKTENFLDLSFRKRVLEIPSIAVNDFMITVLINCVALEQWQESSSTHISEYISFMHFLINQPKDVLLLCSDGIISRLSHDDQYVVNLFNELGKRIVFNARDCYLSKQFEDLSKQFEELESYYYSNWGIMIRTYFSSPWTAISVFSALLIIALTVIQTVYAVLDHYFR